MLKMRDDRGEKIAGRQSRPTVDLSVKPLVPASVRRSRVFAMARPRRPAEERGLIELAAQELGAKGSRRAQAAAVAEAVAALATAQITLDELDAVMAKGAAVFSTPALATLAFADDAIAAEMVVAEATAAFQRNGCRYPDGAARKALDEGVRNAVSARLSERFRRG